MSFRIIAFSDIHLNRGADYNIEPLKTEIESRDEDEEIDALMVLGDTVDNIPRDRDSDEDFERDVRTGREFFEDLSDIAEMYGVPSYAVPGNHDYDIFEEIISFPDGEQLPGVIDARSPALQEKGDEVYGVVGKDVTDFDIGPEIDPEEYEIENYERLVNVLRKLGEGDHSIEQAADELEIPEGSYSSFYTDASGFKSEYERLSESFEQLYDDVLEGNSIFISHIAPFGTDLDFKSIGRESRDHAGSVVNRAIIDHFRPGLAINGHHDYHTLQYFEDKTGYGSDTYAVGLDEAVPMELELTGAGISIEQKA